MALLHSLSYAAGIAGFCFVVMSLASGLLWLSELIEEHSRTAKVVGQRAIYFIIIMHLVLYYTESLPFPQILFSMFCHVIYLQNFSHTWPFISLSSPTFIASCLLVIIDHFLWFFYFSRLIQEARTRAHRSIYRGSQQNVPPFPDIATFFGLCVWAAPLFMFLSLSANDNALPTSGEAAEPGSPSKPILPQPGRSSLFKSLFKILPLDYLPRIRPKARRREAEGIIAPRSPLPSPRPSPMLSPRTPAAPGTPNDFVLSAPPRRSNTAPAPPSRASTGGDGVGLGIRRVGSRISTHINADGTEVDQSSLSYL